MKSAILGFSKALAKEGRRSNVTVNVVIPTALTGMTQTVGMQHYTEGADPAHVAPLVTYLLHPRSVEVSGRVFEGAPGFYAEIRFQRSSGKYFTAAGDERRPRNPPVSWEDIHNDWNELTSFDGGFDNPEAEDAILRSLKLVLKQEAKL